MKMLGGTYGDGTVMFLASSETLMISPSKGWKTHEISVSDVNAFEDVSNASSSSAGKAGLGAAAGFLLAGPLAGLAGLALGASSGSKTSFVFGLGLKGGGALLLSASADEYMRIKQYINLPVNRNDRTGAAKEKKKSKKTTPRRLSGGHAVIPGREKAKAPKKSNLAKAIEREWLQVEKAMSKDRGSNTYLDSYLLDFYERLCKKIEFLNTIKWRYFDELVSDEEVAICVHMRLESMRAATKEEPGRYFREMQAESLEKAKQALAKASWLNNEKKAAELYEKKAAEYERDSLKLERNQKDLVLLFPDFERKIFGEFLSDIGKEDLADAKEKCEKSADRGGHHILNTWYENRITTALRFFDEFEDLNVHAPQAEKYEVVENEVGSIEKRLDRLNALRKKGVISEEEYSAQREKIISDL